MSRRSGVILAFAIVLPLIGSFARVARAESLFLSQPIAPFNIYVTGVDTKYTIFDTVNKIGKLAVSGTPQWLGSPSNAITAGAYTVNLFFDMATGTVRTTDPLNLLDLHGKLNGGADEDFFHSNQLKLFGSGTEDTFDVVFKNNTGTFKTGSDVMNRIMGVAIPNFSDPSFQFAVQPSSVNGQMLFDNTPLGAIEKGVANVWAPTPSGAMGLFVLLCGFGAHLTLRRWISQGWRRA